MLDNARITLIRKCADAAFIALYRFGNARKPQGASTSVAAVKRAPVIFVMPFNAALRISDDAKCQLIARCCAVPPLYARVTAMQCRHLKNIPYFQRFLLLDERHADAPVLVAARLAEYHSRAGVKRAPTLP